MDKQKMQEIMLEAKASGKTQAQALADVRAAIDPELADLLLAMGLDTAQEENEAPAKTVMFCDNPQCQNHVPLPSGEDGTTCIELTRCTSGGIYAMRSFFTRHVIHRDGKLAFHLCNVCKSAVEMMDRGGE